MVIPQGVLLLVQARPTPTETTGVAPEAKTRVGVIMKKAMTIRQEAMIMRGNIKPVTNQEIRNTADRKVQSQEDQEDMLVNAADNLN
jgi:hypothetical protein